MRRSSVFGRVCRTAALPVAAFALACNENLPVGPDTFSAKLAIVVAHDTIVVGDSSSAQAVATDVSGRKIQALGYTWSSQDSTIIGFAATASPDTSHGRGRMLVAKKTGLTNVALSLPDPRFVSSTVTRTQVGVVGGVRVLTTHDSTLTSVNDTGVAIAAGLVRANGALVNRTSTGLRWTHLGTHVQVVGAGDTVRYVAKANGADTLIATHDYCLAGAKCADTIVARVNQQLLFTIQQHNFLAFSFADSVGPDVTLADRRGNGLTGTSVRFVPRTPADSQIVSVTAFSIGITNPANGQMAVPKLVAGGNGAARVLVLGIAPDGVSIVATDSITAVVRQVARRVSVEPLRSLITVNDSVPVRQVARDARGFTIADATMSVATTGVDIRGIYAVPNTSSATVATMIPTLTSVSSMPSNNPQAPQIGPFMLTSELAVIAADTAVAGTTPRTVTFSLLDSTGVPAVNQWVRFRTTLGFVADSAQADGNGVVTMTWTAPDSAISYVLTGVRSISGPLATLADSTGRIVVRRTLVVKPDVPNALKSTINMSATSIAANGTATITVKVRDRYNNLVPNAAVTDFVLNSTAGATFTNASCTLGVCTVTYTAPGAPGPDTVTAKIGGVDVVFSPIAVTIN